MNCFRLPKGLIVDLHGLMTRFWWSNGFDYRIHQVNWATLCLPKCMGGLGFRNLELFTLGLRWHVGTGSVIVVYWTNQIAWISNFQVRSPPSLSLNTTMNSLISNAGTWDQSLSSGLHFTPEEAHLIQSIPIGGHLTSNHLIQHVEKSVIFSMKSEFKMGFATKFLTIPSDSTSSSSLW